VQLDKTEIVIRQRSTLELLDLSMRVLRRHGLKIGAACAIFGIPLLIADVWISAWMFGEDAVLATEQLPEPQVYLRFRHAAHLLVLFLFQFPLISLPATIFLGDQVFYTTPSTRQLLSRLAGIWLQSLWVLGICRLGLVSLVLAFFVNPNTIFDPAFETLMLIGLAVCLLIRAVWPFAPEILGLERCLIRPTRESPISYAVRRSGLHQSVSSDHVSRFILCAIAALALSLTLFGTVLAGTAALVGSVDLSIWYDRFVIPVVFWTVGLFVVVFRFLSYLDSRIRLEGWELELRLRAEGQRVTATMNPPAVESLSNPEQVLA
jgi:hypothetical protein